MGIQTLAVRKNSSKFEYLRHVAVVTWKTSRGLCICVYYDGE
jgi:hypothetical protein